MHQIQKNIMTLLCILTFFIISPLFASEDTMPRSSDESSSSPSPSSSDSSSDDDSSSDN